MSNRIGDIDDRRLGQAVKALLARIETDGGALTFTRSNRQPFGIASSMLPEQPQGWTIQSGSYSPSANPHQAVLSHADIMELLDRFEAATR